MTTKSIVSIILALLVGGAFGFYYGYDVGHERDGISGVQVDTDTYVFTSDVIKVSSPLANAEISSPVTIRGYAVGNWFFEANLPIRIVDNQGNQLGQGFAMTADNWMTTDFVSFEGKVSFDPQGNTEGFILLQKDNPSGLPEYDDERKMPIRFLLTSGTHNELFVIGSEEWVRYSSIDLGLAFDYRQHPDGYILQEPRPGANEQSDFTKAFVLIRQVDYEELQNSLNGREGPPTLNILIFNSGNQDLKQWLEENTNVTNYRVENAVSFTLDGIDGIMYEWDGLYQGKTVAVIHHQKIYLFVGTFSHDMDDRRQDFAQLLRSIKFL